MAKILVVDDEEVLRQTLKRLLDSKDMAVSVSASAKEALVMLEKEKFDLVITDVKMPEMDGIEFLKVAKSNDPEIPIVVLTGFATIDMTKEALQNGAYNFITKPFEAENIIGIVKKGLKLKKEIVRNKEVTSFAKCTFDIEIPSRSDLLGGVMFCIIGQLKLLNFNPRIISTEILMALDEALTNAAKHGNKYDPQKKIFVHTQVDKEKIELLIKDEGEGFNPDKLVDPLSSEGMERGCGRGVFLMKNYMDEVAFNDTGNEVKMVKFNRR
ncbi:MAG: response regulator [Candidatus Omnitrophica bacterium]|nr:response regulator [Candidatus Omnitrophota bacterium]